MNIRAALALVLAAGTALQAQQVTFDRIQHADTLADKFTPKTGQTLADFLKRVRAQMPANPPA